MTKDTKPVVDRNTGEIIQDKNGWEILDQTPIEVPAGFKYPPTLAEQIQLLVRNDLSEYAAMHDTESFSEADDFDVDDDFDPSTPYETEFDPVIGKDLTPQDFTDHAKREWIKEQYLMAERNAIRSEARQEAINEAHRAARKQARQKAGAKKERLAGPQTPAKPLP